MFGREKLVIFSLSFGEINVYWSFYYFEGLKFCCAGILVLLQSTNISCPVNILKVNTVMRLCILLSSKENCCNLLFKKMETKQCYETYSFFIYVLQYIKILMVDIVFFCRMVKAMASLQCST